MCAPTSTNVMPETNNLVSNLRVPGSSPSGPASQSKSSRVVSLRGTRTNPSTVRTATVESSTSIGVRTLSDSSANLASTEATLLARPAVSSRSWQRDRRYGNSRRFGTHRGFQRAT